MSIASPQQPRTIADMLVALGDIPPERILMSPPPGTATEQDAIECETRQNRLCELVDGTLVAKAVGYHESIIAAAIASMLRNFVIPKNLGCVTGSDGMLRLFPGLIRMPDVRVRIMVEIDRWPSACRTSSKYCPIWPSKSSACFQHGERDATEAARVF